MGFVVGLLHLPLTLGPAEKQLPGGMKLLAEITIFSWTFTLLPATLSLFSLISVFKCFLSAVQHAEQKFLRGLEIILVEGRGSFGQLLPSFNFPPHVKASADERSFTPNQAGCVALAALTCCNLVSVGWDGRIV